MPDFLKRSMVAAFLTLVKAEYPQACVAGGYLRDIVLGVTPKDADFFVGPYRSNLGFMSAAYALGLTPTTRFDRASKLGSVYGAMQDDVDHVVGFEDQSGYEVYQVIFLRSNIDGWKVVDRFDYDWCMLWEDSPDLLEEGVEPIVTKEFVKALVTKTATFRPESENDPAYSRIRAERWEDSGKYPDWTFVKPPITFVDVDLEF